MRGIKCDDNHSKFARLLADVYIPELLDESDSIADIPHEFSPNFEKQMNKLVKSQKKPYYDLVSTAGRRAACIGTAILTASGAAMSVDAVREKIVDLVVKHFSGHDVIKAVTDSMVSYPEKIEKEYTFDVPEGFVFESETSVKTPTYNIMSYKSPENYILFYQYTTESFKSKINIEKSTVEYFTDENGILYTMYYWSEKEGNCDVIWQKDNYVFQLNSDLSKDEVINLCISVKPK